MKTTRDFGLALSFRRQRVWKSIFEEELYAVRLPDGEIGYCCVMGRNGEHTALAVYAGAKSFSSYRLLMSAEKSQCLADVLRQDCLQCSLEKKAEMEDGEMEELNAFCRDKGLSLRAPYPKMVKYQPYCMPEAVTEQEDWNRLQSALRITVKLAEMLKNGYDKAELGLKPVEASVEGDRYISMSEFYSGETQMSLITNEARISRTNCEDEEDQVTIPLYTLEGDELKIERIQLPLYQEPPLLRPSVVDEVTLARVMKLPKFGVFECHLSRLNDFREGTPPFLAPVLMTADQDTRFVLKMVISETVDVNPDEMVNEWITILHVFESYPAIIQVRTKETRALLEPVCERAKIKLVDVGQLSILDDLEKQLQNGMEGMVDETLDSLESLTEEELKQIPDDLLLEALLMEDELPLQLAKKLRKIQAERGLIQD